MIPKGELAKDEQELITPAVEVAGVDVKDRGDVIADLFTVMAWEWSYSRATTS